MYVCMYVFILFYLKRLKHTVETVNEIKWQYSNDVQTGN